MPDLTALPNKLDRKTLQCRAIIETPKSRRSKFDYDPETDLFKLAFLLPAGMIFPFDFGFIPSTLGADGDPVDVLALMDEPAHVGCLVDIRLVGVIEAEQTESGKTTTNDRLLAVSTHSHTHEDVTSLSGLSKQLVDQIEKFFVSYNELQGKNFTVKGRGGPKRALAAVDEGIEAFEKKKR